MAGIVSAMAISCDGILAAGTFSRGVGLYDAQGMGDVIGSWSLAGDGEEQGSGVTGLHWSRCGRYLVVAERGSDGCEVWDIRGTGRRLGWMVGRRAETTMQRLGVGLGGSSLMDGGENVYAGGVDGFVRVWQGLGMKEGVVEADWRWKAHDDVVSGLGVHDCGRVVATCSGSRGDGIVEEDDDDVEDGSDGGLNADCHGKEDKKGKDNSVRVWSLDAQSSSQDES